MHIIKRVSVKWRETTIFINKVCKTAAFELRSIHNKLISIFSGNPGWFFTKSIMKKIRNWSLATISLLVILWGIYAFLFGWVVPKTASLSVPRKWNMIPLGQSKNIVHGYLGEPAVVNELKYPRYEQWVNGSKRKLYLLRIYYASDTLAEAYTIHYQYKNYQESRNYLIDSFSIQ